jgi:ABC-type nitrate/sulfonate/bicarbonate transport system permease component
MLSDQDHPVSAGARAPAVPPRGRSLRARPLWRRSLIRLARTLTSLWLFAALAALWWVLSAHSRSPGLPPLESILRRFYELWIVGDAKDQLAPSLEHFAVGYAIAAIAGIGIGALLWSVRTARDATSPYIYFLYVLPTPVLVPAVELIFGIGFTMKVVIIAFAAVWPTLLNTLDGMNAVDQVKLDSARVLGLTRARMVRSVVLPGAGPQIVAGLRSSLQVSIILMVVSEIVASTGGIGYFISQEQQAYNFVDMWTGILMLALIGTVLNAIFVLAEHRVLSWHYGARATEGRR